MSVTAFDVAEYILQRLGPMSAMKLQKLVYYSQAWSLVWDDIELFNNRIEAWANGPVVRDIYDQHKGIFQLQPGAFQKFANGNLSEQQRETINAVLDAYADKSAQWLSDQTHCEAPWINARQGLSEAERGTNEITLESMAEYYGSL